MVYQIKTVWFFFYKQELHISVKKIRVFNSFTSFQSRCMPSIAYITFKFKCNPILILVKFSLSLRHCPVCTVLSRAIALATIQYSTVRLESCHLTRCPYRLAACKVPIGRRRVAVHKLREKKENTKLNTKLLLMRMETTY